MYTQCPECLTVFKLSDADLAIAQGNVRCGHCNAAFDGLRSLAAQIPQEPFERLPLHEQAPAPPQLDLPVYRPNPAQAMLFAVAEKPAAPRRSSLPAFAATRRRSREPRKLPWLVASAVLLLTLAGQVAWADRAYWMDSAGVRAWLDPACAQLGCRLPLRHDPGRLALLSRDIRPHPSVPDALIISATLRNDAGFAQPWPTVKVTLSDFDEKRIAMRRFRPRSYLADTGTLDAGLAAGASTALVFEVVDPGNNAVAFEFDFE